MLIVIVETPTWRGSTRDSYLGSGDLGTRIRSIFSTTESDVAASADAPKATWPSTLMATSTWGQSNACASALARHSASELKMETTFHV